jgi:hypothetical protein
MTFNDRNTALHFLNDVSPEKIRVFPGSTEAAIRFIHDRLPELRPTFRERIQYTGLPFGLRSLQKFDQVTKMLRREPIVQNGTWLSRWDDELWTIFYQLDMQPGVGTSWEGDATVLFAVNHPIFHGVPPVTIKCSRMSGIAVDQYGNLEFEGDLSPMIVDLLYLILFSRHLRWEHRIIPAGQSRTHLGKDYRNETSFPIGVMDSVEFTEFTEIDAG